MKNIGELLPGVVGSLTGEAHQPAQGKSSTVARNQDTPLMRRLMEAPFNLPSHHATRLVQQWKSFQGVDPLAEVIKATGWIEKNRGRRIKSHYRFIQTWMRRSHSRVIDRKARERAGYERREHDAQSQTFSSDNSKKPTEEERKKLLAYLRKLRKESGV